MIESKLRYFLILIRFIVLIFVTAVLGILVYALMLIPFPDFHIALKILFSLLILITVWYTIWQWVYLRYVFIKIELTEDGLRYINFLTLGTSCFYKWTELEGFKEESYRLSYSSFSLIRVYYQNKCVLVIDEATHDNFIELKTLIEKRLEFLK